MTEYSVGEIRNSARLLDGLSRRMLNDYADLREQIERARDGVTMAVASAVLDEYQSRTPVEAGHSQDATRFGNVASMRSAIQSVAHLLPSERGGVEGAADGGEHDAAVWNLIALAEESGAVKYEGEDGMFWILDLDAVYQLENQLRVRNINAGWPKPTHPPAQAANFDRARETPRRQQAVEMLLELGWAYNAERGWEEPAQAAQVDADGLIDAYDEAVRQQRNSGFLPGAAQRAARDRVGHNRNRLRKAILAAPTAEPVAQGEVFGYVGKRELQTMRNHGYAQVLSHPLPDLQVTIPVYLAAKPASTEHPAGRQGAKRWPFVESPGEFTERLREAMRHFPLLGAVRHVLIENPPGIDTLPAAPVGVPDETGWLIEAWDSKRNELKAQWWSITLDRSCDEHWAWLSDSTRALRFARECDARAYIEDMGWTDAKPTEHAWTAAQPRAVPAAKDPDKCDRKWANGWNKCRLAMLAAAPPSTPDTTGAIGENGNG